MPKFMDVHRSMKGITADALEAAHQADLDIQRGLTPEAVPGLTFDRP